MSIEIMGERIDTILIILSREKTLSVLDDEEKLKVDREQTFDEFDKHVVKALRERLPYAGVLRGANSDDRAKDEVTINGNNLSEGSKDGVEQSVLAIVFEVRGRKADWVKFELDVI